MAMKLTMQIELADEQAATLKAKARALGVSAEDYARRLLEDDLKELAARPPAPERRHISEIIADIVADVPPEEFAKLPKDGASEHDHYLYGHPKCNQ